MCVIRFISHISLQGRFRSDQLLTCVISKIVQWPWDNAVVARWKLPGPLDAVSFFLYMILEWPQSYFKKKSFLFGWLIPFQVSSHLSSSHSQIKFFSLFSRGTLRTTGDLMTPLDPNILASCWNARKCQLWDSHTGQCGDQVLLLYRVAFFSPAWNFLLCPPLHLQLLVFFRRKETPGICFHYCPEVPHVVLTRIPHFARSNGGFSLLCSLCLSAELGISPSAVSSLGSWKHILSWLPDGSFSRSDSAGSWVSHTFSFLTWCPVASWVIAPVETPTSSIWVPVTLHLHPHSVLPISWV